MEGVFDKYKPVISRLEDAYKFVESFRHKVVNPLETPGMESIISQLVSSREKKKYAWIPFTNKAISSTNSAGRTKESGTQTKQEDSEMPAVSLGTTTVTTANDEGSGDTGNNAENNDDEIVGNNENKQTSSEAEEKKGAIEVIPVTNQGTATGNGEKKTN